MRKKWIITIVSIFAIVGVYYAIWTTAKNTYENSIDEKIDGVCCDRFFEAISISYPFLWQSATVIRSRAGMVENIASQAGYDRYVFSVLWRKYENSPEYIQGSKTLYDLDFFTSSNTYSSLIHAGKSNKNNSVTIEKLAKAGRLLLKISETVKMDSILTIAKKADACALDFISELSVYKDFSHDINDWRNFDTREYSIKIDNCVKLKKEPFSLYEYFFNNPLDKK